MPTTCATKSLDPSEYKETSPTISVRPTFSKVHSAMIRASADGLRKKLMVRLVVTVKDTIPILPSIAT